jgi:hypothetical protein
MLTLTGHRDSGIQWFFFFQMFRLGLKIGIRILKDVIPHVIEWKETNKKIKEVNEIEENKILVVRNNEVSFLD